MIGFGIAGWQTKPIVGNSGFHTQETELWQLSAVCYIRTMNTVGALGWVLILLGSIAKIVHGIRSLRKGEANNNLAGLNNGFHPLGLTCHFLCHNG